MAEREYGHLRVLVANQRAERAKTVSEIGRSLGHEVVALELDVDHVAELTRNEHPDVALVGLGEGSQHALELIEQIVRNAASRRRDHADPSAAHAEAADRVEAGHLTQPARA